MADVIGSLQTMDRSFPAKSAIGNQVYTGGDGGGGWGVVQSGCERGAAGSQSAVLNRGDQCAPGDATCCHHSTRGDHSFLLPNDTVWRLRVQCTGGIRDLALMV